MIQNKQWTNIKLTNVINVFLPSLSLKLGGIAAFGYHMANPAMITHNIAISSNSCPKRDRVAWKYAELAPTIIKRSHII